jgi:hypothetical protein
LILIATGIILNDIPAGSVFVGMRFYLKHFAFFFLPAVNNFSEEEFKKQLRLLLLLLILQCPVAIYQKLHFLNMRSFSGDVVTGTLMGSGTLSLTMVCSIAVVFAFYLNRRMSFKLFLITVCCLFLPTAINETKIVLFILPLAFALPAFLFHGKGWSIRKRFFTFVLIFSFFMSAFIGIYDHFIKSRPVRVGSRPTISDYFQDHTRMEKYLYSGAKAGENGGLRRGDVIALTYEYLSRDFQSLVFGLGAASATQSYWASFSQPSSEALQRGCSELTLTHLFWELGFLGIFVFTTFFVFFLRDALLLRKCDNIFGSFALGWAAVIAIIGLSMVYTNIIETNVINCLFWYFSGLVVAKTSRMRALDSLSLYSGPHNQEQNIRSPKPI